MIAFGDPVQEEDDDELALFATSTPADVERHLWVTVRLLARSADEQIAYLTHLHWQHSLEALAQHWHSDTVRGYVAQGLLTVEESRPVLAIDRYLTDLEAAHGWGLGTIETLLTDSAWTSIRQLAAHALVLHDSRAVEWIDAEFLERFSVLRPAVDGPVDPANDSDRSWVYRAVLRDRSVRAELLGCLERDPEPGLASAMLVRLFDMSPAADREPMLAAVPSQHTAFVLGRLTELALLERFRDDPSGTPPAPMTAEEGEQILVASNWFLTRMTEEATALDALAFLAERGPSRRIRAGALERHQHVLDRPLLALFTGQTAVQTATPEEIDLLLATSADAQRRLATESMAIDVLEALALRGRTHRIRGYSRDRLNRLGRMNTQEGVRR